MTPCEKLGYKVGDKFEVVEASQGFRRGQTVTLFRDDRSESPLFKGDNTRYSNAAGSPGAYLMLSHVKPLTVTTLNKSKTWLATALIEAGVTKFPECANWAAQDKCDRAAVFSGERPTITKGRDMHFCNASRVSQVELPSLNPQWHQTVLSREEFDQFVAETAVRSEPQPEPTTAAPTLDQLLQDWRNADDFAQRKQTEADEAAAMRDERWQAVQTRAGEMGVTVGAVVSEPELNDGWIEWKGGKCPVVKGTFVDIRLRDGSEELNLAADVLTSGRNPDASCAFWKHDDDQCDIIAYRLARP